jgi:hypothetical protein
VLLAVENHLKRILFAKIYEYVTGRSSSMSSTPLRNSNPELQEITQKSVPQIYPSAWQSKAGQKEKFVFSASVQMVHAATFSGPGGGCVQA